MRKEAIRYFRCLYCQYKLSLKIRDTDEPHIVSGTLTCAKCKRVYPIIHGVPRLLPDQLMISQIIAQYPRECKALGVKRSQTDRSRFFEKQKKTGDSFFFEWKRFSKMYSEYEAQFLDWIKPLQKRDFKGKAVLDAGCGTGRHAYCSAKFGAEVVAFDIGSSVEVAYENTKELPVHVVQADIFNPPFHPGAFDIIYSIGVIHHLPDPKKGFLSLNNLVEEGNRLSIWVYGKEGNIPLMILDPVRRFFFSRLSLKTNLLLASIFVIPVRWLIFFYQKVQALKQIHPFLPQYDFLLYMGTLNKSIQTSIIFDQMLAPIAFYLRRIEIEAWYQEAKLNHILITRRNNNSWRATAVRN